MATSYSLMPASPWTVPVPAIPAIRTKTGTVVPSAKAVGAADRQLTRHSPVIWNVGYMPRFYWDGRSGSLEAQAKGAWGGGNMGVGA